MLCDTRWDVLGLITSKRGIAEILED